MQICYINLINVTFTAWCN